MTSKPKHVWRQDGPDWHTGSQEMKDRQYVGRGGMVTWRPTGLWVAYAWTEHFETDFPRHFRFASLDAAKRAVVRWLDTHQETCSDQETETTLD